MVRSLLPVAVALVLCVVACKQNHVQSASVVNPTEIGFRLFGQLVADSISRNIVISPLCVEQCLAMAMNGARGATRAEIVQVLGLTDTASDRVNRANEVLLSALSTRGSAVQLSIANSVWARKEATFRRQFEDICARFYHATARTLDFTSPTAVAELNRWASDKTLGLVPRILDQIGPRDVALLLSAAYFQGRWARRFDPDKTGPWPFHRLDGSRVERQLMWLTGEFECLDAERFSAVALPFADGRFAMYILVPYDSLGLPALLRQMNARNWQEWVSEFSPGDVGVGLPRFNLECDVELSGSLSALGVRTAFDSARADFSRMVEVSPTPIWIEQVLHKAVVEVNEAGVRAAAVTAEGIIAGCPGEVVADRPFFFAIAEKKTGAILFMGAITDPVQ